MSSKANVLAQINPTTTYVETKVKEVVNMEFKELTPEQYLDMFPQIKLTKWAEKEFKETAKLTRVVKIKGTKKFRPLFANSIGVYYLQNKKEIYIKY